MTATTTTAAVGQRFSRWPTIPEIVVHGIATPTCWSSQCAAAPASSTRRMTVTTTPQNQEPLRISAAVASRHADDGSRVASASIPTYPLSIAQGWDGEGSGTLSASSRRDCVTTTSVDAATGNLLVEGKRVFPLGLSD